MSCKVLPMMSARLCSLEACNYCLAHSVILCCSIYCWCSIYELCMYSPHIYILILQIIIEMLYIDSPRFSPQLKWHYGTSSQLISTAGNVAVWKLWTDVHAEPWYLPFCSSVSISRRALESMDVFKHSVSVLILVISHRFSSNIDVAA